MDPTDLITLDPAHFAAVILLFLPGFISLRVDRLIHPRRDHAATEDLIDIVGYSLLNAAALCWLVFDAADAFNAVHLNFWRIGFLAVMICVVGPILWPLAFRGAQKFLAQRDLVMSPHQTAWDDFFSRKQPCWLVVHLNDGTLIGGYFGKQSIASVGVEAGHIYLEELWQLDTRGTFLAAVDGSKGAILRPGDYIWLEVRKDHDV